MSRITREEYEEKRNRRYERLQAAARRAQNEATQLVAHAKEMADVIPFGQPILIRHHSERRDRNYRGRIDQLFTPDFVSRLGFPGYATTNNGANIRRLKDRLKYIQAHANDVNTEKNICGIRVLDNADESRLQIFFTSRVPVECYRELKSNGFRWSPTNECWQAYRGRWNNDSAERIINKYFGEEQNESR